MRSAALLLFLFAGTASAAHATTVTLHAVGGNWYDGGEGSFFRVEVDGDIFVHELRVSIGPEMFFDHGVTYDPAVDEFPQSLNQFGGGARVDIGDPIRFVDYRDSYGIYYDNFEDDGTTLVVELQPQSLGDGDRQLFNHRAGGGLLNHETIVGKSFTAILEDGREASGVFEPNGEGPAVALEFTYNMVASWTYIEIPASRSTAVAEFSALTLAEAKYWGTPPAPPEYGWGKTRRIPTSSPAAVPEPSSLALLLIAAATALSLRTVARRRV